MKNKILLFLLFTSFTCLSQVGIGAIPNPSSALDVFSIDKGVLLPRVSLQSTTDTTTITNGNVESMLVFNTSSSNDVVPGYYYWLNNKWNHIIVDEKLTSLIDNNNGTLTYNDESDTANVLDLNNDFWSLRGNAGTGNGSGSNTNNFIGTTDNVDFLIKRNNNKSIEFNSDKIVLYPNFQLNSNRGIKFRLDTFPSGDRISAIENQTGQYIYSVGGNTTGIGNGTTIVSGSGTRGTLITDNNTLYTTQIKLGKYVDGGQNNQSELLIIPSNLNEYVEGPGYISGQNEYLIQTRLRNPVPNTSTVSYEESNKRAPLRISAREICFNTNNPLNSASNNSNAVLATTGLGLQAMTIKEGGNVGIGTTTPTAKLDVAGTVRIGDLTGANLPTDVFVTADATTGILKKSNTVGEILNGLDDTNDAWINNSANGRVELTSTSTGVVRSVGSEIIATDSGQIGIGTTTLASSTGLHVEGKQIRINNGETGAGTLRVGAAFGQPGITAEGNTNLVLASGFSPTISKYITFVTGQNNSYGEIMRLGGVGTSRQVHIGSNFNVPSSLPNTNAMLTVQQRANGLQTILTLADQNGLSVLTAKTDGNIGIGTTTPTAKLEVSGKIKAVDVNFSGLPTHPDDAAAATGGLVAGDMYKTATGELRIKL